MATCTGITIGAIFDCDAPLSAGVDERLMLINKSDYDAATVTEANGIITNIVFAGSAGGYIFNGVRSSVKPQVNLQSTDVNVGFSHQVDFIVFETTTTQKENIRRMAWKDLVAIVENNNNAANGDAVFEVYGIDSGLQLTAQSLRMPAESGGAGGAYTLSLKTSE